MLQFFVGSTICPVKLRLLEHKAHIKNKIMEALMVEHFIKQNHKVENMEYFNIQVIQGGDNEYSDKHRKLLQAEAKWIYKLNFVIPNGLWIYHVLFNISKFVWMCILI